MNYASTRNSSLKVSSAHAIVKGLSDEGGLYVPENIPAFTEEEIKSLCGKTYTERAY
ncbi:MAG: threonine synthase, partial [[Eubacterium] saphenum]|nr:threonine synthase [[Eubacterium] saphenum]